MRRMAIIAIGSLTAGCAFFGGLVVGNILTKKKLKTKFDEEAELIRDYYKKKFNDTSEEEATTDIPEKKTPAEPEQKELPNDVAEVIDGYSMAFRSDPRIVEEPEHVKTNTTEFDEDYEEGLDPFLITCDEYGMYQDPDYINANLYWRGGNNLYDEDDQLVDIAGTIGYGALEELMKHKDDDPYVYVRNPRIKVDYEVVWDCLTPGNTGNLHDKDW